MPLLGQAAMLLGYDIVPEAIDLHDDWHTHEHFAERVSIPGFLRATRWVAIRGEPRYLVLYEVAQLDTLTSDAYRQRLDHPTPWTSRTMPHFRGMRRGFCAVTGSFGLGFGQLAAAIRFKPDAQSEASMREWLLRDALPALPAKPGIGSAHLLEAKGAPPMTREQRLRGADAGVDWAIIVSGYGRDALADLAPAGLGRTDLERHGATGVVDALYRFDYALTPDEVRRA